MNISWNITKKDIQIVKKVIATNENSFVKKRRERNIEKNDIVIDKNSIIRTMMMCLLTSQQRSGPDTKVGKFLLLEPFPLTLDSLEDVNNIQKNVKKILKNNGLIRFINRISSFFTSNLEKMKNENWKIIQELNKLKDMDSKTEERELADNFAQKFKGFGPKQSRNFLQALGLTKYEIPIDSRITNWLNDFGFPVSLTSSPLGDKGYYHFVSDGIQIFCEKSDIYPCLLDAAIFSSFDKGEWTDNNTSY